MFLYLREREDEELNIDVSFIAIVALSVLLVDSKLYPTWLLDKGNLHKVYLDAIVLVAICMLTAELIVPKFVKNDQ